MNRIERNYYLNKLIEKRDNGRVKVITDIRRCGKYVLLFDIYGDYLKAEGVADDLYPIRGLTMKMQRLALWMSCWDCWTFESLFNVPQKEIRLISH